LIAERLSGQAPFMAHDPFFTPPPPPEPAPAEPEAPVDAAAEEVVQTPEPPRSVYGSAEAPPPAVAAPEEPPAEPIRTIPLKKPEPAPAHASGEEIDLTGALGGLDSPASPSSSTTEPPKNLDQVFTDIREEATADPDFSAQHMTLARTYMEIGMLDEALSSLETAVRSPRLRFEASAALGRLHQRRGDEAKAIEWLERAAGAAPPTLDEGRSVLYDLGVLLEGTGENSRALAVFLELQADAGDYRDVPSRIDRLARVQTGG
jgi:hypothetical protein